MKKEVIVSITGVQMSDGDQQDVELITRGTYYFKNGKHFILYDESFEEETEAAHNTMKVTNDSMEIIKSGLINTKMVFRKGHKNEDTYQTPFGEMIVGIQATQVQVIEEEDVLKINVQYALDINYDHLSDCSMDVIIRSAEGSVLGLAAEEKEADPIKQLKEMLGIDAEILE